MMPAYKCKLSEQEVADMANIMKQQISEIINCDKHEINGTLFFYWIDKSVKLAKSIKRDLEYLEITIYETVEHYYFITN